jgi:hypothetical protein
LARRPPGAVCGHRGFYASRFYGIEFVAATGAHFQLRYFEESCPKPVAHLWCDRSPTQGTTNERTR